VLDTIQYSTPDMSKYTNNILELILSLMLQHNKIFIIIVYLAMSSLDLHNV